MLTIPIGFEEKVKSLILNFLWSGRKNKVKYSTIIGTKNVGGLDFPDIKSQLEAQSIMSIKHLIDGNTNNSPWKHIPLYHLKHIGGSQGIRHNFNVKLIAKTIPPFYQKCLLDWAKLFKVEPTNGLRIMSQPVVNNRHIMSNMNLKFIKFLTDNNILTVENLIRKNGKFKTLSDIVSSNTKLYNQHYLSWSSVTSSVPTEWTNIVCNSPKPLPEPIDLTVNIYSNDDTVLSITKITSKFIYSMLVSKITEEATAKRKLFNIYSDRNIDDLWKNACLNIYESSIDTYARYFQFKILHNYLAVKKICMVESGKWKLIDSPRCNYCKTDIESIKHLFCECHVTRTF